MKLLICTDVIGSADDDTIVMTRTPTMANTSDKSHDEIQVCDLPIADFGGDNWRC
jgi:hypothetical protein